MLHLHDLYHEKIGLCWRVVDGKDGIDYSWSELLGQCTIQFRGERGAGDRQ